MALVTSKIISSEWVFKLRYLNSRGFVTSWFCDRHQATERRPLLIVVIGCNHGIQSPDIFDTAAAIEQRGHWRELLVDTVAQEHTQFIGEEWGLNRQSVAQEFAVQNGIGWANINTSFDDLDQMHIPRDYVNSPQYAVEQRQAWNEQRERIMVQKINEHRGPATELIIICGFEHMNPLAALLRIGELDVATLDYRQTEWFRAGVFPD